VLTPMMPVLTDIANATREWMVANREVIGEKVKAGFKWLVENFAEIVTWAKRIAIAIAAFYALQAAINAVNAVMTIASALTNPYVLIAVIFVAAIAAVWYFRDEIDAFMAYFFDWCAELGNAWKEVWLAAVDYFYFVFAPLSEFFEMSFALWGEIISFFVDLWNGDWDAMAARFYTIFDGIKAYYMTLWEGLKTFFAGIWAGMTFIFQTFRDLINGDFDAIGQRFTGVWQGIKDTASSALNFILQKIGGIVDSPPFKLMAKVLGLPLATLGISNNVSNVAGADPNAGAMTGSGPMLPPEVMSSQGGNYNETYDTSIQQSTVVIEDKTGRAKPKRGRLPQGVTLKRSAAFR